MKRKTQDSQIKEQKKAKIIKEKQQVKKSILIYHMLNEDEDEISFGIERKFDSNKSSYNFQHFRIIKIKSFDTEFSKIKKLNIGNNYLTEIPSIVFEMVNLVELNICYNNIKEINPKFYDLKKLEIIKFNNNEIEQISDNICKLTELKEIDFRGNKIKKLPRLKELLKLTTITFSSNEIEEIGEITELLIEINKKETNIQTKTNIKKRANRIIQFCDNYIDTLDTKFLQESIKGKWILEFRDNIISNIGKPVNGFLSINLNWNPLTFFPSFMKYQDVFEFSTCSMGLLWGSEEEEKPRIKNANEMYKNGVDSYFSGQYEKAIEYFDKSIEQNPENINSYVNKSIAIIEKLGVELIYSEQCEKRQILKPLQDYLQFRKENNIQTPIRDKRFINIQWTFSIDRNFIHQFCLNKSENIRITKNISKYDDLFKSVKWTKENHLYSSFKTREIVKTMLILNLKQENIQEENQQIIIVPKHPNGTNAPIYKLPKEILFIIFGYLPFYQDFESFDKYRIISDV